MHNRAALLLNSVAGSIVSWSGIFALGLLLRRCFGTYQIESSQSQHFFCNAEFCLIFGQFHPINVENRAVKEPIWPKNHFALGR